MALIRSAQSNIALSGTVVLLTFSFAIAAGAKSKKVDKAAPAAAVAATQTKHKKSRSIALNSNNYLVPPPPAYVPAWLPEALYAPARTQVRTTQPASPYSKYIYTAPGHDSVSPVQPNKYVTYWSKT
jgi:hypothetical protein